MAYIGRSVDVGIFEKQVLTPDSTTTSFALTYAVGSANSLFVVYGGVVQEPGVAYSVSGGGQTIVFSEAPATGTTLYIIYYGKQLTTPRAAGQETTKQTFSGDGTTTLFTLTDPPVVPAGIMVFVDGILQREGSGNNFVSSGSTIAFTAAPDASAEIDVYTLVKEKVSIDTVADGSITRAKLAASHPYWDANGKFGIGTTSPAYQLHVKSSTGVIESESTGDVASSGTAFLSLNDANGQAAYLGYGGDGAGVMALWNRKNGATIFATNNTEQMRVSAAGKVGFGSQSPRSKITVSSQGADGIELTVDPTNTAVSNRVFFTHGGGDGTGIALIGANSRTEGVLRLFTASTPSSSTGFQKIEFSKTGIGIGGAASPGDGVGIAFPATQSASSDPNVLDDYEEGTWTPVLAGVSGGATINGSYGNYTKIGNRVILNLSFVNPNAATLSGSWVVTGIPFATYGPNSEYHGGAVTYSRSIPTSTNSTGYCLQIAGSVSQFGVRWLYSNGTETAPVTGNVPANVLLMSATIVYQTNA